MGDSSQQPPQVSKTTIPVTGLLVDVYGLDELPTGATAVSCLWLHHGRLGNKNDMATIAALALSAWHARSSNTTSSSSRGLIAVAFDSRNHGARLAHKASNDAWRDGNKTHAQDMFGVVTAGVVDMAHLMDALEGYLFGNGASSPGNLQAASLGSRRQGSLIDQHLALGVSQGGHTVWQAMFAEPRLSAGIVVIGCPDYMGKLYSKYPNSSIY